MLATNTKTDRKCALKFLKLDDDFCSDKLRSIFKSEVKILKKLDHPNILKMYDYSYKDQVPGKEDYNVSYLSLEYAANGMLLEYIINSGRIKESVARYLFKQIVEALEYIHKKGYAHRDIKPENILLDENFNIKIADFGLASKAKSSKTQKGTPTYMSPEILAETKYHTCDADIYAAAVTLFIMVTQNCPFLKAEAGDKNYSKILAGNWAEFWNTHYKFSSSELVLSKEFEDLFSKMIAVNKEDRLTLDQIKAHKWFQGETATAKDVYKYFTKKIQKLEKKNKPTVESVSTKDTAATNKPAAKSQTCKPQNIRKYTRYFKVEDGEKLMIEITDFAVQYKYKFKRCPDYFRIIFQIENRSVDTLMQLNVLRKPSDGSR